MRQAVRGRPPVLRALGHDDPPAEVIVDGRVYQRVEIYKHDSWAATARYRSIANEVVCKFNRVQSIFGIPLDWCGRWLAQRETRALARLSNVAGIPAQCGPVSAGGRILRNAVAHAYVAGHPLRRNEALDDRFFAQLRELLDQVHKRQMAYVDLHKRENVLVGDDGRPYLIDFQVCFGLWTARGKTSRWWRFVLARLQQMDLYHLAKHVDRIRPQQLAQLGLAALRQPPTLIRWHRTFAVPLRTLRRNLLALIGVRSKGGRATSELFAEHAIRCEHHQPT